MHCAPGQTALDNHVCAVCPAPFVGSRRNAETAAANSSMYAPGKPTYNQNAWNSERSGKNVGKLYCGNQDYIKEWTLYAACYGNLVGHRHAGFTNPFGYRGIGTSSTCFQTGKNIGMMLGHHAALGAGAPGGGGPPGGGAPGAGGAAGRGGRGGRRGGGVVAAPVIAPIVPAAPARGRGRGRR